MWELFFLTEQWKLPTCILLYTVTQTLEADWQVYHSIDLRMYTQNSSIALSVQSNDCIFIFRLQYDK